MLRAVPIRNTLLALSLTALPMTLSGCVGMADQDAAASSDVGQRSVTIATASGSADALFFTPPGISVSPAVIVLPDISGLRPAYAAIGRDLAARGYAVLIPNLFYRSIRLDGSAATAAPLLPSQESFARGQQWRTLATDEAVMADARALIAWLDARPEVDRSAPVAAIGYDIGAAHAFLAARAVPERIGAVAAIHPSAIATTRDNSPHLFVQESRATYLVHIAAPDDKREPEDKGDLRAAFAVAGLAGNVEVIDAGHGYAVPDQAAYDAGAARRTADEVLALLERLRD